MKKILVLICLSVGTVAVSCKKEAAEINPKDAGGPVAANHPPEVKPAIAGPTASNSASIATSNSTSSATSNSTTTGKGGQSSSSASFPSAAAAAQPPNDASQPSQDISPPAQSQAAAVAASAQEPFCSTSSAKIEQLNLTPGTVLHAELDRSLDFETARVGDKFTATFTKSISSGIGVVIPLHAQASGTIVDDQSSKESEKKPRFAFRLDGVCLDGQKFSISTHQTLPISTHPEIGGTSGGPIGENGITLIPEGTNLRFVVNR